MFNIWFLLASIMVLLAFVSLGCTGVYVGIKEKSLLTIVVSILFIFFLIFVYLGFLTTF